MPYILQQVQYVTEFAAFQPTHNCSSRGLHRQTDIYRRNFKCQIGSLPYTFWRNKNVLTD